MFGFFISARKNRQSPTKTQTKNEHADPECMVMTLLVAGYERLTLKTERGISLTVWGSLLGFPFKILHIPHTLQNFPGQVR